MVSKKMKEQTKNIVKTENPREDDRSFFSRYFGFKSIFAKRFYTFLITFGVVVAILSYNFTPDLGIELGKQSPRTVKANKSISFEDPVMTEEDRNKREIEVADVYKYDTQVLNGKDGVLYQIRYFFQLAKIIKKKDTLEIAEKTDYMSTLLGANYEEQLIRETINLDFEKNSILMEETLSMAKDIMKENIKPNDIDAKKIEINRIVNERDDLAGPEKIIVSGVLNQNLKPTAVFDAAATEKSRIQAREETPPHIVTIVEGQTIVSEGEIVSENDILILSNLGLLNTGFNWKVFLYICFINLVTFSIFYFYLFKFNKNIFDNLRKLWISSTIIIIFIALIKIFTTLASLHLNFWIYLFPIMAASMLGTIIFDTRAGIILSIILAVNLGIAANFDYQMALIYFLGGTFSTFLVSNVSQRSSIMRGGFLSSLFLAFLFLITNLIGGDLKVIALYFVLGIVNGVISAIITIGLLPFIESSFRIVTAMGLLELSHTDQPLLKELLINAPGTYNHSILVSHLSESCANAIGADALLVKVAALYHDLGKMKRPEYFYENQLNVDNIHDRLNPSMSKNIIANHIKDGIEIAIKNKIPKKVVEVISQHHGNSVITYFFKKQKDIELLRLNSSNPEGIMEGHFRYPAKKPQTKESAILMLADATEAAVRSIDKITPKKIEQMVNDIVKSKIDDEQLSEADITIKEVNIVKNTLIDGLISIYHSRISYQEPAPTLSISTEKEMQ
ncbi:MAG: HDIG domain-containing protein [Actinomycetota bacterium]|nr:HDIG domain-containing protein [Actinomycetota bacterium]